MTDRVSAILEAIADYPDGFTLNTNTWDHARVPNGFIVSGIIPSLEGDSIDEYKVINWLMGLDLLQRCIAIAPYVGGWRSEWGHFYLDVSILVKSEVDARHLCYLWKQQAYCKVEDGVFSNIIIEPQPVLF